ncbi:hypothetical protein CUMW_273630 [Citrus unshiu]|uniref:Uncharacterized protein n=1 Tax=Citrus unshiu TaxID=55188 RepID=A0A2H5MYJ5_CITUN|nr:hypothetical protein CUMW_273630 [Citrus unshiu]
MPNSAFPLNPRISNPTLITYQLRASDRRLWITLWAPKAGAVFPLVNFDSRREIGDYNKANGIQQRVPRWQALSLPPILVRNTPNTVQTNSSMRCGRRCHVLDPNKSTTTTTTDEDIHTSCLFHKFSAQQGECVDEALPMLDLIPDPPPWRTPPNLCSSSTQAFNSAREASMLLSMSFFDIFPSDHHSLSQFTVATRLLKSSSPI